MGRPLATAVYPSGAVTWMVNIALSEGWSLHGKTMCPASAWFAMARPSFVRTQPPSPFPVVTGSLECRTVIRIQPPAGTGSPGVTTRSSPALVNVAYAPLTSTDSTVPCV